MTNWKNIKQLSKEYEIMSSPMCVNFEKLEIKNNKAYLFGCEPTDIIEELCRIYGEDEIFLNYFPTNDLSTESLLMTLLARGEKKENVIPN